jgi:hypothetical protein
VKSAREISGLASRLGTPKGLQFVRAEMDAFCEQISHDDLRLSQDEIATLDRALRVLGGAIIDMRRVVSAMLAEAGIASNYVG